MKRILAFALAAACVTVGTPSARADDADDKALIPESWVPGKFSANVAFTSEYIFRGISQTDDSPAVQGGFDWNLEKLWSNIPVGVYAGFWGSNVNFHGVTPDVGSAKGPSLESDWYAGFQGTLWNINWKLGGLYYYYPTSPQNAHFNFFEIVTSLNYDFGLAAATLGYNYSPDYTTGAGPASFLNGKLDIPIWKFTLSPQVGYQWISRNWRFGTPDYLVYGFGLSTVIAGFSTTLGVTDTNISESRCSPFTVLNNGGGSNPVNDACGPQVTFTLSRSF
jgi:uncharacterized protein (TIGR02001 family)